MRFTLRLVYIVVTAFIIIGSSYAQPRYRITANNFTQTAPNQFTFEIFISKTGGTNDNYNKGQFTLTYNSAILPVGATLSMKYDSLSSELPAANQSTNCIAYTGGASGYALYMTAPLDNPGCVIPDSPVVAKIGRYRVTCSLPFLADTIKATWRIATPNPFTKVWYYNATPPGSSVQIANSNLNFIVNGGNLIVPVELTQFTAMNDSRNIVLKWETKTELNSLKYEIERSLLNTSTSTKSWNKIGEVNASGTTTTPREYTFVDNKLQSGKYLYRLKMVDNDGTFEYSKEVEAEVSLPKEYAISQNYPNPFNPTTRIDYQLPFDSKVTLELYSITGERVATLINTEMSAGYYTTEVNASGINLASGVYIYRMSANNQSGQNFVQVKKLMLTK